MCRLFDAGTALSASREEESVRLGRPASAGMWVRVTAGYVCNGALATDGLRGPTWILAELAMLKLGYTLSSVQWHSAAPWTLGAISAIRHLYRYQSSLSAAARLPCSAHFRRCCLASCFVRILQCLRVSSRLGHLREPSVLPAFFSNSSCHDAQGEHRTCRFLRQNLL